MKESKLTETNRKISLTAANCRGIFVFAVIVFIASLFSQLYVTNKLAVKGRELVALEGERAVLEKEISELELEHSRLSSLSYIEKRALGLGFVENANYVSSITTVSTTAAYRPL